MSNHNPIAGIIPRGSLGLKLLLVCLLVLAMGIPLLVVAGLVGERETRAAQVTAQIGAGAGGAQIVGGPMLVVPYQRTVDVTDDQGRVQRRLERGSYVVFAETGSADAALSVEERALGIYRAAIYSATTSFEAQFNTDAAIEGIDPAYVLDWRQARVVMFVSDSRAITNAAELRFADGRTATFEPISDLALVAPEPSVAAPSFFGRPDYVGPTTLQGFAAPAGLTGPSDFAVSTTLELTGAQRFSLAAFAQDTAATIRGDRSDVRAEGYFQRRELSVSEGGDGEQGAFNISWRVPFVARGVQKAADLAVFNLGTTGGRDMAVSFVASDDIYQGVARAVRYGIMFIGIVFLATLIFEAVSGKRAHPAQYILVGLAQCVFYLLLLSVTELIGFATAFAIAAMATVLLLAFYAGASFRSWEVGLRALLGLAGLYCAMYVLMTLEDYALLAGSVVTFVVIAATMIATRRIDWYGRGAPSQGQG